MILKFHRIGIYLALLTYMIFSFSDTYSQSGKKVYLSFILHGNMNYDRYVKPTIWEKFPVIYDSLLYFMDDHPDFKGQMQLSGQTFLTLKKVAPYVIDHALDLRDKGQLNFTGTFYSEPVNINMDGETNYRCARLGTSIISDAVGKTDGYYLQERAYHAQLPWILKNSGVSWVPVVTGDGSVFPFKLLGMDSTEFVCVPYVRKRSITSRIDEAPDGALILIENDFEIPQSFTRPYFQVKEYLEKNPNVEAEWILVEDYIDKFGLKEKRYIDHTAISEHIEDGTYSRWTSDPLDIIVQDYTNKAMSAFRVATIINGITAHLYNEKADISLEDSKVNEIHDPVTWNIEKTSDYPDVEPNYLLNDGRVTELSRAEHLLVWAVNSDSKGWFPLYERRRERINSFQNSKYYSESIINRGMDIISNNIYADGYDKYYLLFNAQPARKKIVTLDSSIPVEVYDLESKRKENSICVPNESGYKIQIETALPDYGYKVLGIKRSSQINELKWREGNSIENTDFVLKSENNRIILQGKNHKIEFSLDDFKIKALTEITQGEGDEVWRDAKPFGDIRVSVRKALYPQLKVERQIDWLVHMKQVFTLYPNRIEADLEFVIPHPTLIRKEGKTDKNDWDPRGLTLQIKSTESGNVFYDIPFAISPHNLKGLSYFCPLSSGIFQYQNGGGYMITMGSGEQAFYTDAEKGEMGVFLGASTSSGPIRNVSLDIESRTEVTHEPAWYLEPFHGTYKHKFLIFPYNSTWQDVYAPAVAKQYMEDVYVKEFFPEINKNGRPVSQSLLQISDKSIHMTSMETNKGDLQIRLNDKGKERKTVQISFDKGTKEAIIPANGIVTINF